MIGIDLGVKSLLTGADDAGNLIVIPGPKPLRAGLRQLRRLSRAHARKRPGSANRLRATARLARLHARVANIRADALRKATSMLAVRYETIVIEDLHVAGMVRNRRIARALADQAISKVRPMLAYKTVWNGGTLVTADRWYPSSKICSACGIAKATLALSERIYHCDNCGLVLDRDVNAAQNLLKLAASGAESRNARRATIRPGPAGHVATTRESGTGRPGKTGTATLATGGCGELPMGTPPQRVSSSI
jgi:putative transposase